MRKKGISVVIPVFKRKKLLNKIIFNLLKQKFPKDLYEIIIVDSFNSVNLDFKNLYHVKKYNIFDNSNAKKRNFGIQKSNFNNIVFIDDDCLPEDNFLKKYYELLQKIDYKSFLCGSVIYPKSLIKKNRYIAYRSKTHFVVKKNIFNKNSLIDPNQVVTMNMGFKYLSNKKILFNNKFKNYGFEDFEFCYRFINKGYKFYKSSPLIYHIDNRKFEDYLKKFYFLGRAGSLVFMKINDKAFKKTNYFTLENFFLIKKLIDFKLFRKLLIIFDKIIVLLNYFLLFKFRYIIKLNMSLSYLLGYADRAKQTNEIVKWYK